MYPRPAWFCYIVEVELELLILWSPPPKCGIVGLSKQSCLRPY